MRDSKCMEEARARGMNRLVETVAINPSITHSHDRHEAQQQQQPEHPQPSHHSAAGIVIIAHKVE